VFGVTLLIFLGTLFYVQTLGEPQNKAVAFVSIGLDQQILSTEVSSYEILRATESFSDTVLGWTVEPSFVADLEPIWDAEYAFSGQRQEKQNLIFEVYGVESVVPAQELVDGIRNRLAEYNSATHAAYVLALDHYSFVEGQRADGRTVAGATLLAFVLSILGVIFWDYASRY